MQAVTHDFHWNASRPRSDCYTTHAIILADSVSLVQKVRSGMGNSEGVGQCLTSSFKNPCGCTALDRRDSREMTQQMGRLACKEPSEVASFAED